MVLRRVEIQDNKATSLSFHKCCSLPRASVRTCSKLQQGAQPASAVPHRAPVPELYKKCILTKAER